MDVQDLCSSATILERLHLLHQKLIDLELTRIERLLERLGNPHLNLPPVVHIAGTNGKGSTLAFLKAMHEAAGLLVHTYTSPHLVHFHERIGLAGHFIEEDLLADILMECETANQGDPITYFEITTAAAFVAFSRTPADVLLLEVGLGGRFDATNVIDKPALSIITPIDLDHQNFLGDDVKAIAREKAGIFKKNCPAIVATQSDEVLAILQEEAEVVGAPLSIFGQDWTVFEEHGRLVFQDEQGLVDLPLPKLVGRHQMDNAGTAIAAARALATLQDNETALARGLKNAVWPARMQRLTTGPLVELAGQDVEIWLDGGHNPLAAQSLAETLADMEDKAPRPLFLIFGMMSQKDAQAFLEPFRGLAKHVSTVGIEAEEAAYSAGDLYEHARQIGMEADTAASVEDALRQIMARPQDAPRVLICGSLYLAGSVLKENG